MSRKPEKKPAAELRRQKVYGKNGVFYTFPQGKNGPIQIRIDFGQVPEPQGYYYADSFLLSPNEDQGMVILSFGRREGDNGKFADRIDIVVPARSLFGAFWASIKQARVEEIVDKILQATGMVSKVRSVSFSELLAPTFFANMIFLAAGDGESTLDFYYLSPREIHLAKMQKKDMHLLPTIRVIISSVLTKHLLDVLRTHAEGSVKPQRIAEGSRRAAH